jgi:hypothetical protein
LGLALRSVGFDPIEADTAMAALDVLDETPDVRMAVVSSKLPARTPHAVAFARMMKHRDKAARLVLITHQDWDDVLLGLGETETDLFEGIVERGADIPSMAADVGRLLAMAA